MKRIDNIHANWLDQNLIARNSSSVIIGNGLPQNFKFYAKIFHPFEIAINAPDELKANERYGRMVNLVFEKNDDITLYEETPEKELIDINERQEVERAAWLANIRSNASWKQISEKYGIRYHNEINLKAFVKKFQEIGWPTNLGFPSEGYLPREELRQILQILKKHSSTDMVFIYQKAPHTIWKDDFAEDLVLGGFDEVFQYFEEDFIGYLYDQNKKWLIYTDIDLSFTLVGGDHELIQSLSGSALEVLKCSATTRIDEIYASK